MWRSFVIFLCRDRRVTRGKVPDCAELPVCSQLGPLPA